MREPKSYLIEIAGQMPDAIYERALQEVVRCRDCKHLDDSEYERWDNTLAEAYGEPPLFCDLLSVNEWRMDGNGRVAEARGLEVSPDDYCSWGVRKENHAG